MAHRLVGNYKIGMVEVCAYYGDQDDILEEYNCCFYLASNDATWDDIKQKIYIYRCSECGSVDLDYKADGVYDCIESDTCTGFGITYKVYVRWRWKS